MIALWPAIDLMGGNVVRLLQGDPSQATTYGRDPGDVARRFADEGADGLHVVDLDAAFGRGDNRAAVEALLAAAKVPVQVGGGIRSLEAARQLLSAGAARVVVGSLPFSAPERFAELLAALGPQVVVALDCREGRPTVKGWTEDAGTGGAVAAAARLARQGVAALLVTDIARDGAMTGPNLALLSDVRGAFPGEVIASGGMRGAEDLVGVAAALAGGPSGAIFGRALHGGAVTVKELVDARGRVPEGRP